MRWLSRFSLYVFVLLVLFFAWVNLAHAFYAGLNPPPGFSSGSVGSASNPLTYSRTLANAPWVNGTAVGNLTANVGGRAVTMPAQARMAANAGRYLAAAVRMNPAAWAITGVAAVLAPIVWDAILEEWVVEDPTSGLCWYGPHWSGCLPLAAAKQAELDWCHATSPGNICTVVEWPSGAGRAKINRFYPPPGCSGACDSPYLVNVGVQEVPGAPEARPATDADWDEVGSKPPCYGAYDTSPGDCWGDEVPNQWPNVVSPSGLPLPTGVPVVNPNPAPNPNPDPEAIPASKRVPTGDPVPIPDTEPQKWEKPWIDIVPSPTPSDPWRVDVRPGKDVDEDPDPLEDPEGTRTDPDKPPEETVSPPSDPAMPPVPDLYERKYPDGIAGVWATYKDALTSGPLGTFLASLVPGFGVGGCPSFSLPNATVLGVAVGGEFALPCEVWAFVRLVMIISALLLARRLVFGG